MCVVICCAPRHAHQLRLDNPVTLGYLGGMYRPNATQTLGMLAEERRGTEVSFAEDTQVRVDAYRSQQLSVVYHWHPSKVSAFFVGGSLDMGRHVYEASDLVWNTARGQFQTVFQTSWRSVSLTLGVPVGFTWIWNSGFTMSLDIGPRLKFYERSNGQAYSHAERDRFARWGGIGLLGYSFAL